VESLFDEKKFVADLSGWINSLILPAS
jgi:hypothetical protein